MGLAKITGVRKVIIEARVVKQVNSSLQYSILPYTNQKSYSACCVYSNDTLHAILSSSADRALAASLGLYNSIQYTQFLCRPPSTQSTP